jgi:hypothetical protein
MTNLLAIPVTPTEAGRRHVGGYAIFTSYISLVFVVV